jgi:hypothetical protein
VGAPLQFSVLMRRIVRCEVFNESKDEFTPTVAGMVLLAASWFAALVTLVALFVDAEFALAVALPTCVGLLAASAWHLHAPRRMANLLLAFVLYATILLILKERI